MNLKISHQYLLLILIGIITFIVNNDTFVPDIMESRNIITAREMVYQDNWIVTTMNGELRLEKPPLPTWLTAVAEIISPDSIFLQRAMAGLSAVMLVVFLFLLVQRILRNRLISWMSVLVFCTSYNAILMGRTASWDIYCHAFMLGGIYFLYRLFFDEERQWTNASLSGLFLGLSFMSKGPVSYFALLLPFLIATFCILRPSMRGRLNKVLLLAGVCIVVSSWWYLYIYVMHYDEMAYVANKESSAWVNRNVRPWYYYWSFFLESGIWAILLLTAIGFSFAKIKTKKDKTNMFFLVWTLATVVLLSLFPEKKTRYLFPVLIPASMLIGQFIVEWAKKFAENRQSRLDNVLFKVNAVLPAIIIAAIPVIGYKFIFSEGYISIPSAIIICITTSLVAFFILRAAIRNKPLNLVICVSVLFLVIEIFAMPSLKYLINNPEMNSIANTRNIEELKDIQFYHNKKDELRIELVYAAHRTIKPMDYSNDSLLICSLPMVVLSRTDIESEMSAEFLEKVNVKHIDMYDDNRRSKNNKKRYSNLFIYNVTLITAK